MKILVSNIGSTSFKFRLFDFSDGSETGLAVGGVDRIGGAGGQLTFAPTGGEKVAGPCECPDHAAAISASMDAMVAAGVLSGATDVSAVAFKAVMGGDIEPVTLVTDEVLKAMEYFIPVAPAHNPPYIAAMRSFREALPGTPLVACFEPGFHRTNPPRRRTFACPPEWATKYGIRRYGFHGASHRYIATRAAEVMPDARRVISCHLGGSSSLCAICDGESAATSMGFSAQSGLPQGTRVGEFDAYALAVVARETGRDLDDLLDELGNRAGLAALSGTDGDMRDIEEAAKAGDAAATLAIDVYVTAIRDYLGAYLVELGGADAIVFSGGIGQKSPLVRSCVCDGLAFAGIELDDELNAVAAGECRIEEAGSSAAIWVMDTNEELIVARQAAGLLGNQSTIAQ